MKQNLRLLEGNGQMKLKTNLSVTIVSSQASKANIYDNVIWIYT